MVSDATLEGLCNSIEVVATSCNNRTLARRASRLFSEVNSLFKNPDFFENLRETE